MSGRDLVLRDVLAIAALPAMWIGRDPRYIAEALRDTLTTALAPELIHVRAGGPPFSWTTVARWRGADDEAIARAVEAALARRLGALPPTEAFPLEGEGLPDGLVAYASPIGPMGDAGMLVIASTASGFPSDSARLLTSLAANQAGTALRNMRLAYELADTRRELAAREKEAALGQLVAGVAHELRTPLTFVSNNLHLLRRRLARAALVEETANVDDALAGVDRIDALVRRLRRWGMPGPSARSPRNLADVVGEAVALFEATHRGTVMVEAELRATPPLPVDALLLQQAVLNLLENGAEAMNRAGLLRVRVGDGPAAAWIEVADEGAGVAPELRARIFEPFFTTKPEGMGLGLAIVRRAAEAHGGSVVLLDVPRGATFRLLLPYTGQRAEAPARTAEAPNVPAVLPRRP